jgi:hypothetical protein
VSWLFERISARRAELSEQVELLRKQLAEIEVELADLGAAERVVGRMLAEPGALDDAAPAAAPGTVPRRGQGQLPADYARLWRFAASAAGPVTCKDACAELGLSGEPKHVEGVRVKLKRLVARGWLIEPAPGRFTAAAPMAVESGP